MKTETEIAKENVERYEGALEKKEEDITWAYCIEHLASCQRFLDWINQLKFDKVWDVCWCQEDGINVLKKITDLQNAILIYEKEGIK